MDTNNMTLEQLQRLVRTRYQEACRDDVFYKLATVARELGENTNSRYGPKYLWSAGYITVYVDDYGNFMNVVADNKRVSSTHPCEQFIIPGEWLNTALAYYPEAQARKDKRTEQRENEERARLIEQLT